MFCHAPPPHSKKGPNKSSKSYIGWLNLSQLLKYCFMLIHLVSMNILYDYT